MQDLARPFPISQPAISRHLKVLEDAGLIETRIDGTARPRRLTPTRSPRCGTGWANTAPCGRRGSRLDDVLDSLTDDADQTDPQEVPAMTPTCPALCLTDAADSDIPACPHRQAEPLLPERSRP